MQRRPLRGSPRIWQPSLAAPQRKAWMKALATTARRLRGRRRKTRMARSERRVVVSPLRGSGRRAEEGGGVGVNRGDGRVFGTPPLAGAARGMEAWRVETELQLPSATSRRLKESLHGGLVAHRLKPVAINRAPRRRRGAGFGDERASRCVALTGLEEKMEEDGLGVDPGRWSCLRHSPHIAVGFGSPTCGSLGLRIWSGDGACRAGE